MTRHTLSSPVAELRDAHGRPLGRVLEAVSDRLTGRGAGTVLLRRSSPTLERRGDPAARSGSSQPSASA